jgi:hypothetical protein
LSQRNGLGGDAITNGAMNLITHIDSSAEHACQLLLKLYLIEETAPWLEVDQEIDVAVGRRVTSGY